VTPFQHPDQRAAGAQEAFDRSSGVAKKRGHAPGAQVNEPTSPRVEGAKKQGDEHTSGICCRESRIEYSGRPVGGKKQVICIGPRGETANERVSTGHDQSGARTFVGHITKNEHQEILTVTAKAVADKLSSLIDAAGHARSSTSNKLNTSAARVSGCF
jgi:hypothetical protein